MDELTLEQELIEDLTTELSLVDPKFSSDLLTIKVKNAIRDVKTARKYPASYSETQIEEDLKSFYSNCRAIALNDYNKVGIDFEESHNESGVSTKFTDRNKLFFGILPISKT